MVAVLATGGLVAAMLAVGGHGTPAPTRPRTRPVVAISSSDPVPGADDVATANLPEPTTGEPPSPEPDATVTQAQEPAVDTTTETTVAPVPQCVNSFDARCGEFRWDPSPDANQPIHIDAIVLDPPHPVAGQPFTVTIQWSDPDADIPAPSYFCSAQCVYNDPLPLPCGGLHPQPAGAWTPPAPRPGAGELVESLYFPVAGTFTWEIGFGTSSSAIRDLARDAGDCVGLIDPYSSWTVVSGSITIGAGLWISG